MLVTNKKIDFTNAPATVVSVDKPYSQEELRAAETLEQRNRLLSEYFRLSQPDREVSKDH